MKTFAWIIVPVLLVMSVLSGCQKTAEAPKDNDKMYDVKAKVVSVDVEKKTITLDHEDIPGLMKAMTMTFPVEDAKALKSIKPGDQVQGRLRVRSGENVITELHKQ